MFGKKWKNINLSRVVPIIYRRYCESYSKVSGLTINSPFYINFDYASGEVFFEKFKDGFWMVAIEVKIKQNTHYYFMPNKKTSFYSINLFSGSHKIGYLSGKEHYWAHNQILVFDPATSHDIYLKSGTTLKYSRLIYTESFLNDLLGGNKSSSPAENDYFDNVKNRVPTKAELFLQERLFNLLRYERDKAHYRASIFSVVYASTSNFLKLLPIKGDIKNEEPAKKNYAMIKAAKILEANFSEHFPGINKLAFECNISVSKFKRDFKETYGITPLNYFRNIQFSYTMASYNQREKTIKESATDLGFKKNSSFSVWYKKINHQEFDITKQSLNDG